MTGGHVPFIPLSDDDTKFQRFNLQGEHAFKPFSNPNFPSVDHEIDEDSIWQFAVNNFNMTVIKNNYIDRADSLHKIRDIPTWSFKMMSDIYYDPKKFERLSRHWNYRMGLDDIKCVQAMTFDGTRQQQQAFKEEISAYIEHAEMDDHEKTYLKDVYITNHIPKEKKYITHNKKEDQKYFDYY